MPWAVENDEDFDAWLRNLAVDEELEISAIIKLLRERGPNLKAPYARIIKGSKYQNMKELRIQIAGKPWRILFAFDPNRTAVLLVGGNKGGDPRWYKTNIPIADRRFRQHLDTLKE